MVYFHLAPKWTNERKWRQILFEIHSNWSGKKIQKLHLKYLPFPAVLWGKSYEKMIPCSSSVHSVVYCDTHLFLQMSFFKFHVINLCHSLCTLHSCIVIMRHSWRCTLLPQKLDFVARVNHAAVPGAARIWKLPR